MNIVFPRLTGYQQRVYDWFGDPYRTGRIAVLNSVRQSGKSFFCCIMLIRMALEHAGTTSAIYEPTLTQARVQYKSIYKALNGSGIIKSANASLLEIELVNGSTILFKSTEQSSRGFTLTGLLILDECAYLVEDEIYSILNLVNAHNAPIIIASTPFAQTGYYYTMYMLGLEGSDNIKTFDWAKEKEVERFLTPERKKFYKSVMSRQKFRTECEGQFLSSDGLLFIGIDKCVGQEFEKSDIVTIGIDFGTGKDEDYTVMSVMGINGEQKELHRTNKLSPLAQVDWIMRHVEDIQSKYTIRCIIGETNSIGNVYTDMLNQRLRPMKMKITEWVTTNKSKQDLVTALQLALENGDVSLLPDPVMLDELRRYEAQVNEKTHSISYNGAKGSHDDTVIALMLSYWAVRKQLGHTETKAAPAIQRKSNSTYKRI